MKGFLQSRDRIGLVAGEFPSIGLALFITEWFYKFHSFTLEFIAFFATWQAISFGVSELKRRSGYAETKE